MDIEVAQALHTIDRLPGEELPDLAAHLLAQEVDTPAVRELAGLHRPTVRDAGHLFNRILADLDRPSMSVANAAAVIARYLARRAISGEMSPREIAYQAASLYESAGYPHELTEFVGYSDWYGYASPNETAAIDAELIKYARDLLDAGKERVG
jgi:hypothetical protein